MGNEIIQEAINKISSEKEVIKQQELNRLQGDLIANKFNVFENEYAQTVEMENKRHETSILTAQSTLELKKNKFLEQVKINLDDELEKKYKFEFKIAELKKLIDNE